MPPRGLLDSFSTELNEQEGRIAVELHRYRAYVNCLTELQQQFLAFLRSDASQQIEHLVLQSCRLIAELVRISEEHAGGDGWTLLSIAGQHLHQLMPDDFARMKREHGNGSLRELVSAVGRFEVRTEELPHGGTRALYRLDLATKP